MDAYRVSFIGNREIFRLYRFTEEFEFLIRLILCSKEYVEFYVGRDGDFDVWVASQIKRIQRETGYENFSLILVLPYAKKGEERFADSYDEIRKPLDKKIHFKNAITKRNEWLVEHSDLLISCVEKLSGRAYKTILYAEKKGVEIMNLR